MYDKEEPLFRKILYAVFMVTFIFSIIASIAVIVIMAIWPSWLVKDIYDWCWDNGREWDVFDGVYDCQVSMKTWIIVLVCISILFGTLINILCLRVLYYGWKEQEERAARQADLREGLHPPQNPGMVQANMVQPAFPQQPQAMPQGQYYPVV